MSAPSNTTAQCPSPGAFPFSKRLIAARCCATFGGNFRRAIFPVMHQTTIPLFPSGIRSRKRRSIPRRFEIERGAGAYLYTRDGREIAGRDLVLVGESARPQSSGDRRRDRRAGAQARARHLRGIYARRGRGTRRAAARCAAETARAHVFLRRRLDGRGSGAEDGAAVLAEHRQAREEANRCARTRLSRRHGGSDVGGRGLVVCCRVQRDEVSGFARAFGVLFSLPGGENSRDLRHRLRRAARAAAGGASRRNRGADRRAAAARRGRNDCASGGISAARAAAVQRSTTCCSSPTKC